MPTLRTYCPDLVSFCRESHPQPLFFTPPSHTPGPFGDMYVGDMYVHNMSPHTHTLHPKIPLFKTASTVSTPRKNRPPPTAPPARPPTPAPGSFPPVCVVLSFGKCAPSGPRPPAERPLESCSSSAYHMLRCASCRVVNTTVKMLTRESVRLNAANEKCGCV